MAIISAISIIAGYMNLIVGINSTSILLVLESIPVIKTSLGLVWLFIFNMMYAFYNSKGSYDDFSSNFMVNSLVLTPLYLFFALPGYEETPVHLGEFFSLMFISILLSQLFVGKYLKKDFWEYANWKWDWVCDADINSWSSRSYSEPSALNDEEFKAVQDFAYVLECFASDVPSEGKTELDRLINKLEKSSISNKESIVNNLNNATRLFINGEDRHARINIARASRLLWREIEKNKVSKELLRTEQFTASKKTNRSVTEVIRGFIENLLGRRTIVLPPEYKPWMKEVVPLFKHCLGSVNRKEVNQDKNANLRILINLFLLGIIDFYKEMNNLTYGQHRYLYIAAGQKVGLKYDALSDINDLRDNLQQIAPDLVLLAGDALEAGYRTGREYFNAGDTRGSFLLALKLKQGSDPNYIPAKRPKNE